jgi:hypothetical protein
MVRKAFPVKEKRFPIGDMLLVKAQIEKMLPAALEIQLTPAGN